MVKNPLAKAGHAGLVPGSGRSLEKKRATYSNILAWWAAVLGVAKELDTT